MHRGLLAVAMLLAVGCSHDDERRRTDLVNAPVEAQSASSGVAPLSAKVSFCDEHWASVWVAADVPTDGALFFPMKLRREGGATFNIHASIMEVSIEGFVNSPSTFTRLDLWPDGESAFPRLSEDEHVSLMLD